MSGKLTYIVEEPKDALTEDDINVLCDMTYECFRDHPLLRRMLPEWTIPTLRAVLGAPFRQAADGHTLILARAVPASSGDQGRGRIIGALTYEPPSPHASTSSDEDGGATTKAIEEAERIGTEKGEMSDEEKRQAWYNGQAALMEELQKRAFGDRIKQSWYIPHLAVFPKFQNHGVGRAILAHIWSLAQEHKVGLTLVAEDENIIKFYVAHGYEVNGTDKLEVDGETVNFWALSRGVGDVEGSL